MNKVLRTNILPLNSNITKDVICDICGRISDPEFFATHKTKWGESYTLCFNCSIEEERYS